MGSPSPGGEARSARQDASGAMPSREPETGNVGSRAAQPSLGAEDLSAAWQSLNLNLMRVSHAEQLDGMMATQKQIAANRANAKRSTGPRTQQGKLRSSMNARKHGLSAKAVVADGEDLAEFEALQMSLVEGFSPRRGMESELVSQLATSFWRLSRIPLLEATFLRTQQNEIICRDPRLEKLIEDDIGRAKRMAEISSEYIARAGIPVPEETDGDLEKRIRANFEREFPPLQRPETSPGENVEMLLNISRYETRLVNSIEGTLNMLLAVQHLPGKKSGASHSGRNGASGNSGEEPQHRDIELVSNAHRPGRAEPGYAIGDLSKLIVIGDEDPAEFQRLYASLAGQFNPRPGAEDQLVLVAATILWRWRRIPRLEAKFVRTQKRESPYRDPRVDQRIEDEILLAKHLPRIAANFRKFGEEALDKNSDIDNSDDEAAAQRIRELEERLTPKQDLTEFDPAESQEMLVRISSYESALIKCLTRVIKILVRLQNIRAQKRTPLCED